MLYPFKIRIRDPELDKILKRLAHDRTVTINGDKAPLKKLSYKISPIRKDIFMGFDHRNYESNVSLKNPFLNLKPNLNKEKKRYKDWEFYL